MTARKSIIVVFFMLTIILWASLAGEVIFALSQKGAPDSGKNHALIIGISKYDKWPKLKSPAKDAEQITKTLTGKYNFRKENVILLTDNSKEKPTLVNILTYLDEYLGKLTAKDNLLVFFSGNSTEDDKGETYWIPKDGKKKSNRSWLKHSDLCEEFFASKEFKAKSLCIVTDSVFSRKLIRPRPISLTPDDLRYVEKISEKASKTSREVISFNDEHWPGSKETNGMGLFTYYINKALEDNWLKVIDLENLIFAEDILFPITKIAGTRLSCGRLKTPMDKRGQFIIASVAPSPVVNVVDTFVSPGKGYQGDTFLFEAKTSSPASVVYIEIEGKKKQFMEGSGTSWKYRAKVASLGDTRFTVIAVNPDDVEGKARQGRITTIRKASALANVVQAVVTPETGLGGDEYHFTANTDIPAKKVALVIKGKRFEMTGSDTRWSLTRKIEDTGTISFSVLSTNEDGIQGGSRGGTLLVKAPRINVVEVKTAPKTGYPGDDFLITVKTDSSASEVSLEMDGMTYAMEGSGSMWRFKKKVPEIGKKKFTVIAKNIEGAKGLSKTGEILTRKRPPGIPDVAAVVVNPKKVYQGETFAIKVKTSLPADTVFVEIQGKKQAMEGANTEWSYFTEIDKIGDSKFRVIARNKEGKQGKTKDGSITIAKRPLKAVDVIKAEVSPKKGYQGQEYIFKATTNTAAKSVTAIIGKKRYKMTGSGTGWSLKKRIDDIGTVSYSMVARNPDGVEGGSKFGTLPVKATLINVVELKTTPKTGYAGEEFAVTVKTDHAASAVSLNMDGMMYSMEGSGKKWRFKKKIPDIGKKKFTVTARNIEGADGPEKSGEILARMPIPDVASFDVNPGTGYVGDSFAINVQTSTPSDSVVVEIEGKKYAMEGAGTDWLYSTKIDKIGTSKFRVIAKNEEGKQGKTKEGSITTAKRPLKSVDVVMAEVSPKKGTQGQEYIFKATTNTAAKSVTAIIAGKRYKMTGSGTGWSLKKRIDDIGTVSYSMVARNQDGVEGGSKIGTLPVRAASVKVVDLKATPKTGYAGEEFTITVKTDRAASAVSLNMDGMLYAMEGSGSMWRFKKKVPEIGKKKFTVIARNIEGADGPSKSGEILARMPIPDVASVEVSPGTGYAGDSFAFNVQTSTPSDSVVVEIEAKKYAMEGTGTDWHYSTKVDKIGTSKFRVIAKNEEGKQGKTKEGEIITTKKLAEFVNVIKAEVSPKKGYQGQEYIFKATTNTAAKSVTAIIGEKRYKMTGSGTGWSLKKRIEDVGTISYSMVARNPDGVEGGSKFGTLPVKAALINVVELKTTPKTGYAGEEFAVTVKTDHAASAVSLNMDGMIYSMEGSDKKWRFKKKIPDIGKKKYTVTARNIEGADGPKKIGEILARMPIPDVASFDVSPGTGYVGDSFAINVQTSTPSDSVIVEIEGKKYAMEGAGTDWHYSTKIGKTGTTRYRVIAKNKEGKQGQAGEGEITTTRKPGKPVNVVMAEASPKEGFRGKDFTFTAGTDSPAKGVTLVIGDNRYEMTGSDTKWSLKRKIEKAGTFDFSIVARNEDDLGGEIKTASVTVKKLTDRFKKNPDGTLADLITGKTRKRFVDNRDGTVIDLLTSLMWLKQPKQIALSYEKAVEYCRDLELKDYAGWRLPTISELKKLIDKKQKSPALPPGNPFKSVITHVGYWSKSKHKFGPAYMSQMNLWHGKTGYRKKTDNGIAWPVRYIGPVKLSELIK